MKKYAIYARLGAGCMLLVCWGLVDSLLAGVVFMLALTALSAVRYRFAPYHWLGVAEAVVCVAYAFFWLPALLGLWLPAIGLLEDRWADWEKELLRKGFEDRGERLKLEASREASERELRSAARLAEMAERSRIAQDIHDHVGHELSGASIALQTAIRLHAKGDERTGELLAQSAARLESASEHLREAVHNLKPSRVAGAETLGDLCEAFEFCPARFSASGDLSGSPYWELLEANLKEALTNVAKHSDATLVEVKLDGNADYIRLQVTDNGKSSRPGSAGLGIQGIGERVRAAGGTLTVSTDGGFSVVCVLPKQEVL
jgi:signal transduction histidine kinase